MIPADKPKNPKLWKNPNTPGKKKSPKDQSNNSPAEMKKLSKKRKLETAVPAKQSNSKEKEESQQEVSIPHEKMKKVKAETPEKRDLKRKNQSTDSTPAKKCKRANLTRKEWKILRLDKTSKTEGTKSDQTEAKPDKKNLTTKEWKKFKLEKKGKSEIFELGHKLKLLWEKLRREDCKVEEKCELLKQACNMLKGHVMEFTFAHDTTRVLECVVSEGSEAERTFIFNEVKNAIIHLTKSKYGKFVIMKLLKYGSKDIKNSIMKEFHGKVVKLLKHTQAAEVVELAFNECANAAQRFELVQEFYGPTFKFFKTTECHDLNKIFMEEPERKTTVIQNMKEELMKVLEKTVVKHSMVHHILWQFMKHADPVSKAEIIESVRDVVPEILHSKDGSRVGIQCVWFGNIKDRKVIIKAMKTFVTKIAMEEHGHRVLIELIKCCDDTKLMEKRIIGELEKDLLEVAQNVHGKKVLVSLLNPHDPHYFTKDVINLLDLGEGNEHSKKDPQVRAEQMRQAASKPLLNLIKDNIKDLYKDSAFCLFALTVLKHAVGDKTEAFQAIADLTVEPYTSENKNSHIIEHPGSNFLLKQLIYQEKNCSEDKDTFSEVLITRVPNMAFKSWVECNRGAFLLVSLIETQLPSVVERIKKDLAGCNKYLGKKNYAGAEILLKKLKE